MTKSELTDLKKIIKIAFDSGVHTKVVRQTAERFIIVFRPLWFVEAVIVSDTELSDLRLTFKNL